MPRPTLFDDDLSTRLCLRIANGARLDDVTSANDMPDLKTASRWLSDGRHRQFEDLFCWAQEHRDKWDYAEDRWGPYPRTEVTASCMPTLFERFVMRPASTRQFQYVDEGATIEREIRSRRFRLSVINGGRA